MNKNQIVSQNQQFNLARSIYNYCLVLMIIFSIFMIFDLLIAISFIGAFAGKHVVFSLGDTETKIGMAVVLFSTVINYISFIMGYIIFKKILNTGQVQSEWYSIYLWFSIIACYTFLQIPLIIMGQIYYHRVKNDSQSNVVVM